MTFIKKTLVIALLLLLLAVLTENHLIVHKEPHPMSNTVTITPPLVITNQDEPDEVTSVKEAQALYLTHQYVYEGDEVNTIATPQTPYVMVNKLNKLPEDFIPEELIEPAVPFSFSGSDPKKLLQKKAGNAAEKLFQGAEAANLSLYAVSGYRSYERQAQVFKAETDKLGLELALKTSALPGHSEHQTGLALDVSTPSVNFELEAVFATTPESAWLNENAHYYGFVIRYPLDKVEVTGYTYEPWHIRYLGVALATHLYENNLTLEEYYAQISSQ